MTDNELIMYLLREKRVQIEGTITLGPEEQAVDLRPFLSRLNAEIARRLPHRA